MFIKAIGSVLMLLSGFVLLVLAIWGAIKLIVLFWLYFLISGIVGWLLGILLINWGTRTADWPGGN